MVPTWHVLFIIFMELKSEQSSKYSACALNKAMSSCILLAYISQALCNKRPAPNSITSICRAAWAEEGLPNSSPLEDTPTHPQAFKTFNCLSQTSLGKVTRVANCRAIPR